jgi:anti-sigma factor RsiW
MNCHRVQRSLSAYADNVVSARERVDISGHLDSCRECAALAQRLQLMRSALRNLPARTPPNDLNTRLNALASRERIRRLRHATFGGPVGELARTVKLWLDDIMRPLALPFAGGLVSAVVLFAVMTPVFAPPENMSVNDVPTSLSTEAAFVSMGPFTLSDEDIVVDLTVDEQGRMVDYSTPNGQRWVKNPEIRKSVENALFFTLFSPATNFGQPLSGKIRLTFRRTQIDVRG